MLLASERAPLVETLRAVVERVRGEGVKLVVVDRYVDRSIAIGSIADDDSLDSPLDPSIDLGALTAALLGAHVPPSAAPVLAHALADREDVLDLATPAGEQSSFRPPTLFERHALQDVLGRELAALLPSDRVLIDRAPLTSGALNHCEHGGDGVARIRLLDTNGTTLAGRTHALVHELGHALIGVAKHDGRPYRAGYGQLDYGRFLAPQSFDSICDEEALVRAIADAWLLRRRAVTWSRTWPGAVDAVGKELDADDLAAFARFRLSQGLGLPATPIVVRRRPPR